MLRPGLLVSLFLLMNCCPAQEKLVVRTFPDGYKDNRIGTVFSNAQSLLRFFTWADGKKFSSQEVLLQLRLPEGCRVSHFSVFRSPRENSIISKQGGLWSVKIGKVKFNDVFVVSGSAWAPQVPLTFSSFEVFIVPEKPLPAQFTVSWCISGENFAQVSGEMLLQTLPAPKLQGRLQNKQIWSWFTMAREMWDFPSYDRALQIIRDAGCNGILEANSGFYLPEKVIPTAELAQRYSLTPVVMQTFNASMRPGAEDMRKAGYPVRDQDLKVDAGGTRLAVHAGKKVRQIYCFSAMAEPDSPVRASMVDFYKTFQTRGFQYFFPDYEPFPYNGCYCDKCRRNFAAFAKIPLEEALSSRPGDLVYKYPLRWYQFRCHLLARIFALLNQETGAKIGWNSYLVYENTYFPPANSFGHSAWVEDPRIFDSSIAFHDVDCLASGLGGVWQTEAFLQKGPDGRRILKKPVITRATSLVWRNWGYLSVLGHFEKAAERGYTGLGIDYRRQLHKLEIAQDFALGVDGVEIHASPEFADAAALTGICEGLQYAVNYEDRIKWEFRLPADGVRVFDCTEKPSPFADLAAKGSLGRFLYMNIAKFGPLQVVSHANDNWLMASVFNWDFFQSKKVRLEFSQKREEWRVNIDREGQYSVLERPFTGQVSLEIPPGSYVVIRLDAPEKNAVQEEALEFSGGRPVQCEPAKEYCGLDRFIITSNQMIARAKAMFPDAGFRELDPEAWKGRIDDQQ